VYNHVVGVKRTEDGLKAKHRLLKRPKKSESIKERLEA
jgi:hypothetical protein